MLCLLSEGLKRAELEKYSSIFHIKLHCLDLAKVCPWVLGHPIRPHLRPAVIPLSVCNTRADYSSNIQVKTHCFCSHFTGTRKGNNQVGAQPAMEMVEEREFLTYFVSPLSTQCLLLAMIHMLSVVQH